MYLNCIYTYRYMPVYTFDREDSIEFQQPIFHAKKYRGEIYTASEASNHTSPIPRVNVGKYNTPIESWKFPSCDLPIVNQNHGYELACRFLQQNCFWQTYGPMDLLLFDQIMVNYMFSLLGQKNVPKKPSRKIPMKQQIDA